MGWSVQSEARHHAFRRGEPMKKPCSTCGTQKDLADFYTNKRSTDGLTSQCRECIKEVGRNSPSQVARRKGPQARRQAAIARRKAAPMRTIKPRLETNRPDPKPEPSIDVKALLGAIVHLTVEIKALRKAIGGKRDSLVTEKVAAPRARAGRIHSLPPGDLVEEETIGEPDPLAEALEFQNDLENDVSDRGLRIVGGAD
jgi:hypothetical protein